MKMLLRLSAVVIVFTLFNLPYPINAQKNVGNIYTCSADDLYSLNDCSYKIANGQADNIEITNLITCSSGVNSCNFAVKNIIRPVRIYGRNGSGAGFVRLDFTGALLSIDNSTGVTISDLSFIDSPYLSCGSKCSSPIAISNSKNIIVDHITILNPKVMGIEVSKTNGITIKNSIINNAAIFGIWFNSDLAGKLSASVNIENNLFKDNSANAIHFSGVGTTISPSVIKNNTFIHNHRDAVFKACGVSGTDPCSGGQLSIEPGTNNLVIQGNVIKDGKMDAYDSLGYYTSGIEFTNYNVNNVMITQNDIHNNRGTGIIVNSNPANISNVSIINNKLYNNGVDIIFPGAKISGNCFSAACMTMLSGKIYADPNPCLLTISGGQCTSAIIWTTNDATNTSVKVGGNTFSINPSGAQNASWIPESQVRFDLYSGSTLLDSVNVRGLKINIESGNESDSKPPAISVIHYPQNPAAESITSVTLTATASDENGITNIKIFADNIQVKECTISPCQYAGDFSVGTHSYYATATDVPGNSGSDPASGLKYFKIAQIVEVVSAFVSNACPMEMKTADVKCKSSAPKVNCIGAKIGDRECLWTPDYGWQSDGCVAGYICVNSKPLACFIINPPVCPQETKLLANYNKDGCISDYVCADINASKCLSIGVPVSCPSGTIAKPVYKSNIVVFSKCSVGEKTGSACGAGVKNVLCYVNTDKCMQTGSNKTVKIDVLEDPIFKQCSAHQDQNSCNADGNVSSYIDFNKSLLLYLSLNNNTLDSSTYGNNGTSINGTVCSPVISGRFGTACDFDGVNDIILINKKSSASIRGRANYTIEGWFYLDTFPVSQDVYFIYHETIGDAAAARAVVLVEAQSNLYSNIPKSLTFRFRATDDPGVNSRETLNSGANSLTTGQWYHFAAVFNSVDDVHKLYLNGNIVNISARAFDPVVNTAPQQNISIGNDEASNTAEFDGRIDEIRVWGRALSDGEINASANNHVSTCEWVMACLERKSSSLNSYCVPKSTSPNYQCKALACGAECDYSVGCPENLVGDVCYYSGVCQDSCACSYQQQSCPAPGTVSGKTCYYGSQTCIPGGCTISKCDLQINNRCDAVSGCIIDNSIVEISSAIDLSDLQPAAGDVVSAEVWCELKNKLYGFVQRCLNNNTEINSFTIDQETGVSALGTYEAEDSRTGSDCGLEGTAVSLCNISNSIKIRHTFNNNGVATFKILAETFEWVNVTVKVDGVPKTKRTIVLPAYDTVYISANVPSGAHDIEFVLSDKKTPSSKIAIDAVAVVSGVIDFMSREDWIPYENWDPSKKVWTAAIDTDTYHSTISVNISDTATGLSEIVENYYTVKFVRRLDVSVKFPDQEAKTIRAENNIPIFYKPMNIEFVAEGRVKNIKSGERQNCDNSNCIAAFSLDNGPFMHIAYDEFTGAFVYKISSSAMLCNQEHSVKVKITKTTQPEEGASGISERRFLLKCETVMLVSPPEKRTALGFSGLAFRVLIVNPDSVEKNYDLSLSLPRSEFMLSSLQFSCTGTDDGCAIVGDHETSLFVPPNSVSSVSMFAKASRAGVYPIDFTATGTDKFSERGTLQVFAESLPEFSIIQLLFAVLAAPLIYFIIKRKHIQ